MTIRVPVMAPDLELNAFKCAFCHAYAQQRWDKVWAHSRQAHIEGHHLSHCMHCGKTALWINGRMVYPTSSSAPAAAGDLPAAIKVDYDEAAGILSRSPRGSAALLRLCIQKLCKELGLSGKELNTDIGLLVSRGLDVRIQMALDVVRVVGNNAVHPGEMDLRDDQETAQQLFSLVNLIVQAMITQPKEIEALYAGLPEGAKKAIEKRDGVMPS